MGIHDRLLTPVVGEHRDNSLPGSSRWKQPAVERIPDFDHPALVKVVKIARFESGPVVDRHDEAPQFTGILPAPGTARQLPGRLDRPSGKFESENLLDLPGLGFMRPGNRGQPARGGGLDLAARSPRCCRPGARVQQMRGGVSYELRGGTGVGLRSLGAQHWDRALMRNATEEEPLQRER